MSGTCVKEACKLHGALIEDKRNTILSIQPAQWLSSTERDDAGICCYVVQKGKVGDGEKEREDREDWGEF